VGVAGELAANLLPATPSVGISAYGAIRWSRMSLDLSLTSHLPASRDTDQGRITARAWLGTVAACVYRTPWIGCARGSSGVLLGTAEITNRNDRATPYVSAGVQVGIELPISSRWFARIAGHVDAPLFPTELQINQSGVWTTPTIGGGLNGTAIGDLF
jgi:hypothetical protein